MSWTTNPYCTVDDVKALLRKNATTDDAFITGTLIPEAQAWIDERLGFSFQTDGDATTPATRLYNGNDHDQLLIDRIQSLSKVELLTYHVMPDLVNGGYTRTTDTEDVTGDVLVGPQGCDPAIRPGFILERLISIFPYGRQNIRVSGVFGYSVVPQDIARACARLAAHYLLARDAGYEDKTSGGSSAGYGTKTFKSGSVPEDIECAVDRHRRRMFRS